MGKEAATEKGKEMRKRKLKFICPHCKKESQIVDVMQDAEVHMPVDYVDTEGFLHYDRQEPMIVSRKGHFACDECAAAFLSGHRDLPTGTMLLCTILSGVSTTARNHASNDTAR